MTRCAHKLERLGGGSPAAPLVCPCARRSPRGTSCARPSPVDRVRRRGLPGLAGPARREDGAGRARASPLGRPPGPRAGERSQPDGRRRPRPRPGGEPRDDERPPDLEAPAGGQRAPPRRRVGHGDRRGRARLPRPLLRARQALPLPDPVPRGAEPARGRHGLAPPAPARPRGHAGRRRSAGGAARLHGPRRSGLRRRPLAGRARLRAHDLDGPGRPAAARRRGRDARRARCALQLRRRSASSAPGRDDRRGGRRVPLQDGPHDRRHPRPGGRGTARARRPRRGPRVGRPACSGAHGPAARPVPGARALRRRTVGGCAGPAGGPRGRSRS